MSAQPDAGITHRSMTAVSGTQDRSGVDAAVANLIEFLETGLVADTLFAADAFADLSLPQWRVQAGTADDIRAIRFEGHPYPGQVHVERVERTDHGFTLEFEERWHHEGQQRYCREMIRADVVGETIVEVSIYCTGDWDEATQRDHAAAVQLIRP